MTSRPLCVVALLGLCAFTTQLLASVGRTPGQFAVSANGAGTYQIPIRLPPGPHGLQPNLGIVYSSQSGTGSLGPGWQLSGLSSIARCNSTIAQDTTPAAITLTYSDRFCLDGQRLRLTSSETLSTYGQDATTYQTEVANFSNVTAHSATGNGPAYFTVQLKNGLIYEYGNVNTTGAPNNNSQVIPSGSTTVVQWLLDKVSDRNGNNYVVTYGAPNGAVGVELPATISYTPSSAGATTYNYTVTFAYGTRVNQNASTHTPSISGAVAGMTATNPNLLSTITLAYSGTTVQTYSFGYTASATTSQATLTSVTQCGGSAGTDCLSPTNIAYQSGAAGVASATTVVSGTLHMVAARDFNHDGHDDILYSNGSTLYVAFATATGFSSPVQVAAYSGATAEIVYGDLLGGGQVDIMIPVSNVWWRYAYNGSAFVGSSTGIVLDGGVNLAALTDIDGDGLADLVTVSFNGTLNNTGGVMKIYTRHNNSTAGTLAFASSESTTTPPACISNGGNAQPAGQTQPQTLQGYSCNQTVDANGGLLSGLRSLDFDGDGRKDIVVHTYNYYNSSFTGMSNYFMISNGATFSPVNFFNNVPPFIYLNANNDRCTDVAVGTLLYVNSCNGTLGGPATLAVAAVGAMDWDGDGRDDLLVANGANFGVMESTGSGATNVIATSVPYSSNSFFVFDQNGDGLADLGFNSSAGGSITYSLHNGSGAPPDLVSSFTDGYGNSASPTYVSIAQSAYSLATDATYPYQNYIGSLYVVNEAIFSDSSSTSATFNFQYYYYGAWSNLQGRGFQAFNKGRVLDSRNGTYAVSYYERKFPLTGMLDRHDTLQPDDATEMVYGTYAPTSRALDTTSNNQRTFAYNSNATVQVYEVGGSESTDLISTTSTVYTFDNYGNATNVVTTLTDNDPGSSYSGDTWTTNVTNTTDISANSTADLAAWCLPLLDETQIVFSSTLSGSTAVTRTQTYTPDTPATCRIRTIITEPTANSTLYKVTEALGFDSFGNVNSDSTTGANMPSSPASRLTSMNWGTSGQFPNTLTDPSGAVTTFTYSSTNSLGFGVPDSVKNANNLTTSWGYDNFGRKILETRPDGTFSSWTWTACTTYCGWSNSVYQVAHSILQTNGTSVIRTDTTLFDPIDRPTQGSGPLVTGTSAFVRSTYNSLGLLYQKSMPFIGSTQYNSTYSYDLLNRVTSVTRPISTMNSTLQSTSYQYAGRTRIISDPYSQNTTLIIDVNGWLRQTKDALGYSVTQAYDAAGSLTGITDSVGNTLLSGVTYKYGIQPFLVASTDADRGAWAYTVDSLGERTAWTDAKGQSFSTTYDALSRPLTRTEPDSFSQWTWGSTPGSFNVGQLIAECSSNGAGSSCGATPAYSETRTFDSFGRPWKRAISELGNPGNDPGSVFLFTSTYSTTTGLPNTFTYPISTSSVALNLQYGYQYGLLQSITDTTDSTSTCGSTCTLWAANTADGFGHITQETLGNAVVTVRAYDAVTSWLTKATAGVGGGAGALNQTYLQDENGNVTQRQDNNQPLTESMAYDADNRVKCVLISSTCTTPNYLYDQSAAGPGNLTTRGSITETYPAAGQPRPHAITSTTISGVVSPYSYDANGNMTARASSTPNITWSSANYPTDISTIDATGNEEVQLSYGPDRQRWKQIYTGGPTGTENTYYVGGLIDLVFSGGTSDYRHYIYAGSEPVAVYSRTSTGVNTMHYMLEDQQGGVSAIVSNTGAVTVNEAFNAFGTRVNPTTWGGSPSTTDLNTIAGISRQGYTFQTWLGQSMNLNHMNGRVQDAFLGRFLSPDTHVPDPSDAQSYNRYSYAANNPFTLIDPTGFDEDKPNPTGNGGAGGEVGSGAISVDVGPISVDIPDYTANLPIPDLTFAPSTYYTGSHIADNMPDGEFFYIPGSTSGQSSSSPQPVGGGAPGSDTSSGSTATTGMSGGAVSTQSQASVDTTAQSQGSVDTAAQQNKPFPLADTSIDELSEVIVHGARSGTLGVPINFDLPNPNEQIWLAYRGNIIVYMGDHFGKSEGNVGKSTLHVKSDFTAIIHTHPKWAEPRPGPGDWGKSVPLYGISPSGTWVILPGATSETWLYRTH